jgi:hypothetical protein
MAGGSKSKCMIALILTSVFRPSLNLLLVSESLCHSTCKLKADRRENYTSASCFLVSQDPVASTVSRDREELAAQRNVPATSSLGES